MDSEAHVDPAASELLSSHWARYQRLLHVFLGVGTLGYVPTVAVVISGLRCQSDAQAFQPVGSPVASTVCSGPSRGPVLGVSVVCLLAVVVGLPLLYIGVLMWSSGRARFRDVYFWRRYGMLYANFVDSRWGLLRPLPATTSRSPPGHTHPLQATHHHCCPPPRPPLASGIGGLGASF
jgi:hypothetical protein